MALPQGVGSHRRAPNIVISVLDNLGFAQLGCYGSAISTPSADRLARGGIRYTNFHTTTICAPTRAALLTGRNHHAVGMGVNPELATGHPGYMGKISKNAATIARILHDHGYGSYAAGKWHLTHPAELTAVGPFDHWPLGCGFDHFHGFAGAMTNQWHPELIIDNQLVDPPVRSGYHLSEDLVDRSIQFLREHSGARPADPFFLYLCFGACHPPHHVPRDYADRYRGQFDAGWDVFREQCFERQQRMGIVSSETMLAPRNPGVPAWNELSAEERRVCARTQEIYAAFLEHADAQIGRLLAFLEQANVLDDTIFILLSDEGAVESGGRLGAVNTNILAEGANAPETLEEKLQALDVLGSETTHPLYAAGWAQVGNTPFKGYSLTGTYAGGITVPCIFHWPARILDGGGIRAQYHHVVDVLPTLLELLDVGAAAEYDGVPQLPLHGTSMAYTFDHADASTRKTMQYYEMRGNRAMWHKGWTAIASHRAGEDFDSDRWELYHDEQDFSQCRDLAGEQPEKLREMIGSWWAQAGKHNVLPLDDRNSERQVGLMESSMRPRYVYHPDLARVEKYTSPPLGDRSYVIEADVEIPETGAQGVLVASGGRFGGYVLYIDHGHLVYVHNLGGRERRIIRSSELVAAGRQTLGFRFIGTAPCQGVGELSIDGRIVGSQPLTTNPIWRGTESLYCGREGGTPVGEGYTLPFGFTGTIHSLAIEIGDENSGPGRSARPAATQIKDLPRDDR